MKTQEEDCKAVSLEEMKRDALKLYNEGATAINHWSSFIEKCIRDYHEPNAQQLPSEQRIKILEKLVKNLTIQLMTPEPTTHKAEEDINQKQADELFLRKELSELSADADDKVTDEMITNASYDDYNKTNYLSYQHAFENGAKWMRDGKIKPDADVRNEAKERTCNNCNEKSLTMDNPYCGRCNNGNKWKPVKPNSVPSVPEDEKNCVDCIYRDVQPCYECSKCGDGSMFKPSKEEQAMYPEEFILWMFFADGTDWAWGLKYNELHFYQFNKEVTLPELYQYWLNNIAKK
jgi:hypothetical protein